MPLLVELSCATPRSSPESHRESDCRHQTTLLATAGRQIFVKLGFEFNAARTLVISYAPERRPIGTRPGEYLTRTRS